MRKTRPHFYYRVAADTTTGGRLRELMTKCDAAAEQARLWAMAQGATSYYESPGGLAGGVCALDFTGAEVPEGWVLTEGIDGDYWLPQEGSDVEKAMYDLPVVTETPLIGILGFKPRMSRKASLPLPYTFGDETPVIFLHNGFWYTDVPYECEALGMERMTENAFTAVLRKVQSGQGEQ